MTKGPGKVNWPDLKAAATALRNVAEAARLAAANLPEYQQRRFIERVNKRATREGWLSNDVQSQPKAVQSVQNGQDQCEVLSKAEQVDMSNLVQSGASIINATVLSKLEKRQYLKRALNTPLSEIDETSDLCVEMTETTTERGTYKKIKKPC